MSAEGDHSVLGGVSSFVGGTVTGALSPVIKTGNRPVDFVFDRVKDYLSGAINYASRTSPGDWNLDDLNKKGIDSVKKGTLKGIGKEINKSIR